MTGQNPDAGWYPNPSGDGGAERWFDGERWTEHLRDIAPAARQRRPRWPWAAGVAAALVVSGGAVYAIQRTSGDRGQADVPTTTREAATQQSPTPSRTPSPAVPAPTASPGDAATAPPTPIDDSEMPSVDDEDAWNPWFIRKTLPVVSDLDDEAMASFGDDVCAWIQRGSGDSTDAAIFLMEMGATQAEGVELVTYLTQWRCPDVG